MQLSSGFTFGDNCTSSDTSCLVFLCGSPSWWRCRFQGCIINAWSGSLEKAFSVDEASVKEAVVACCALLLVSSILVRGSGREFVYLCTLSFV